MSKIAAADIDLASDEPVLYFTGEPAPSDVPHRDLNAADLAYIARVRALQASSGQPVKPARPMDIAAVANDIVDLGGFSTRAPAESKAKATSKAKKPAKARVGAAEPASAAAVPEPITSARTDTTAPGLPAEEV